MTGKLEARSRMEIEGGHLLRGDIHISGSKNASLPIIAAALLAPGKSRLMSVPQIGDVRTMISILRSMGVLVAWEKSELVIEATELRPGEIDNDLMREMRASILLLGPLLTRYGSARIRFPGGCDIGERSIEQHIKGLQQLGALVSVVDGYVIAQTHPGSLHGDFTFDVPSVTGTEHLMLAAALTEHVTTLHNVAKEPEIVDLAKALLQMGVLVEGAGTSSISVFGTSRPSPFRHCVMPDRIECGTFLIAGALMGDPLTIVGGVPEEQAALILLLRKAGANISVRGTRMCVQRSVPISGICFNTAPYPGIPTDLQPQLMALLSYSNETSVITENVFESRFKHVEQLRKLGAAIKVEHRKAIVLSVPYLCGAEVHGTDLRACAGLLVASLSANGVTILSGLRFLDRGYEQLDFKLNTVGANITRE